MLLLYLVISLIKNSEETLGFAWAGGLSGGFHVAHEAPRARMEDLTLSNLQL